MDKEKKDIGYKMRKEAIGYLFSCLPPEEGYHVSDRGLTIFYYRYLVYKTIRTLSDLVLLFTYAVFIVLTCHTLMSVEAQKVLIVSVFVGQVIFIKRARQLRSVEYSIGVGHLVGATMQTFPEEFVFEEKKEDTSNGK